MTFKQFLILTILLVSTAVLTFAQQQPSVPSCGNELLINHFRNKLPAFKTELAENIEQKRDRHAQLLATQKRAKTTKSTGNIQVVFHIVLTDLQIKQLGDSTGIRERVISQLQQLNADWQAKNADSILIPPAFKPLYGNMNIAFSLATRKPDGTPTPGFEIIRTSVTSFDLIGGTVGSTYFGSDAKYRTSGGADAWDPSKYYNVWVINMTPYGILGISTPPRRAPWDIIPEAEQGTCVFYGAFGKRTNPIQYFTFPQAQHGRTLTHETGHFFDLHHIWGTTDDCSDDDGIIDTPPQTKSTPNNSPAFPVLDDCTPIYPGIMFMNFMDYAVDSAALLFTKEQCLGVQFELSPLGLRSSLLLEATVIDEHKQATGNKLYPNPVQNRLSITHAALPVSRILLYDLCGRIVKEETCNSLSPEVDLSTLQEGIYFIKTFAPDGTSVIVDKLIKD